MQCVKLSNRNGNQLKDEDANLETKGKVLERKRQRRATQVKATGCACLIGCKTTSSDGQFSFFLSKDFGHKNIAVNQKVLKARSAAFGLIALAFSNRADRLKG